MSDPDITDADILLDWVVIQTGPTDVLISFDGTSKACRKILKKRIEHVRYVHESWIVYTPTERLGRLVAFPSDNKEMAFVSMPVARSSIAIMPRDDTFQSAGESNTFQATYT
eukprot:12400317-Karenia_brevis.AAC.1